MIPVAYSREPPTTCTCHTLTRPTSLHQTPVRHRLVWFRAPGISIIGSHTPSSSDCVGGTNFYYANTDPRLSADDQPCTPDPVLVILSHPHDDRSRSHQQHHWGPVHPGMYNADNRTKTSFHLNVMITAQCHNVASDRGPVLCGRF